MWKDILKAKDDEGYDHDWEADNITEDLTEKVIEALSPMYKNKKEVFSSNIMGSMHEENLQRPYTKKDVSDLIDDIKFEARTPYSDDSEYKDYKAVKQALDNLERLI